jgi:hypothetical protein
LRIIAALFVQAGIDDNCFEAWRIQGQVKRQLEILRLTTVLLRFAMITMPVATNLPVDNIMRLLELCRESIIP